jgi:hypothetical protein
MKQLVASSDARGEHIGNIGNLSMIFYRNIIIFSLLGLPIVNS